MNNVAVLIYPDHRVADLGLGVCPTWLVDANVDGQFVFFGFGAEAGDELGFVGGLAEGEGLGGGGGNVIGGFGEEEGFAVEGGGTGDEGAALGEVVGEGGGGCQLADGYEGHFLEDFQV